MRLKASAILKNLISMMLILMLASISQVSADANQDNAEDNIAFSISSLIARRVNPLLTHPDFSAQAEQLQTLYLSNQNQLLWLGPDKHSHIALALLDNAKADGLNPEDYDASLLQQHFISALSLPPTAYDELAQFDTALSIALIRFVSDLHSGRVIPKKLNYPPEFGNKQTFAVASLIKQAIDNQDLAHLAELAAPQFKQYRQLKQALAKYREMPKEQDFQLLDFKTTLRPGAYHPQLATLRERLITLQAMSPESPQANSYYSASLQEGVKAFQHKTGLKVDGIIGPDTANSLNQTMEQKIQGIELAMERLRWLPNDITDGPMIIVNIPAFQLWASKSADDPDTLNMKVIVGKAQKNQTPMLLEQMKYLEFMPYWNIPKSIMEKEILPKVYEDTAYLQNEDIELVQLVRRLANQEQDQESNSWETLASDIRRGRVRARQRPGKKNPLGKVKFVFPNKEDVYLHDTSSPRLFNLSQRDLSHGCVRVAEAGKLAEFVLSSQPENRWNETAIQEAMSGEKTRRVTLRKPISVLFFYSTSYVDQDGQVHFYRDIYEQDAILNKALQKIRSHQNNSLLTAKANASPS